MINNKKIAVVLPAYNAELTLERTVKEIPRDIVDEVILVDDASSDKTVALARNLELKTIQHSKNRGYGGNQKTCYEAALKSGADIVVMVHPDYQYTPKLITPMASMIAFEVYDCILGSRILGGTALSGGMPVYKYIFNRLLSAVQNLLLGQKISEYHTGYRAFSRKLLESLPLENNSDDFVFDSQMLVQIIFGKFRIGEISCPTKYFAEASSINFLRSVKYGLGCLICALQFRLKKLGFAHTKFLDFSPPVTLNNKDFQGKIKSHSN